MCVEAKSIYARPTRVYAYHLYALSNLDLNLYPSPVPQAPCLELIEIRGGILAEGCEAAAALTAVALWRAPSFDAHGLPVAPLLVDLVDFGMDGVEPDVVSEVINRTLPFMGRGGWVEVRVRSGP